MKPENKDRFLCQFPDCNKTYWKAKGEPDYCPEHRKLIKDVMFILSHVRQVQKSGLVVPGQPGFEVKR